MKRFVRRWAWLLLLVGPSLGLAQRAAAQSSDPASVATAFERSIGVDLNAGLALISDDAVLRITPPPQGTPGLWSGKEQVRQALQYSIDHKVKREIVGSPQVNGNTATYTVMASNDFFEQLGVAPVQFSTQVVVEGGKIKSFVTTILPSEQPRVGAAAQALQAAQAGQGGQGGQAPAGMPKTGSSAPATTLPAALLLIGLLCLAVGILARGRRSAESAQ